MNSARRRSLRASRRAGLAVVFAAALLAMPAVRGQQYETADAWTQTFGEVQSEHPWVRRAADVFERVSAAAYQRRNRPPKLLVLRRSPYGERPFAASLRDGSVLVSFSALELCYGSPDPAKGDARAAFLFGHELAHLAGEDFQRVQAFGGFVSTPSEANHPDASALADTLRQEQLADRHGLLFMTMAGFEPAAVLADDAAIFSQWMAQSARHEAASAEISTQLARQRAQALLRSREEVVAELDYFHAGVRLLQVGRYDLARRFLEAFNETFPGREVLNNLGLAHVQLALAELAECDAALLSAYRLPAVVDDTTLASRLLRRGGATRSPCLEGRAYRRQIETARAYLEEALEIAPAYLPARINLLSLLLLDGDGLALAVATEGLERHPEDLRLRWLSELAKARVSERLGVPQLALDARDALRELARRHPDDAELAYNYAALLAELGDAASTEAWATFLRLEPTGPWAHQARLRSRASGEAADPEGQTLAGARRADLEALLPWQPGPVPEALEQGNAGLARQPFRLGSLDGVFHRDADGLRLLEVDFQLTLIEVPWSGVQGAEATREFFGAPRRQVSTPAGELWVYRDFAVELCRGQVCRIVAFATDIAEKDSSGV